MRIMKNLKRKLKWQGILSRFITEQNIRERSGSTLKQKSRNSSTPIEESDAFGDTIVTIDQLERVQKLTYNWNGLEDIPPGKSIPLLRVFDV